VSTYPRIEDHGAIGNMHTIGLVATDGTLDWLCMPHFDSPSVFASLLDHKKGGDFLIAPVAESVRRKQFYWPGTNVLVTRFFSAGGVGEIRDFITIGADARERGHHEVVRLLKVTRGSMRFRVECRPAFHYAEHRHTVKITAAGARFAAGPINLALQSKVPLRKDRRGSAVAEFELQEGESAAFHLKLLPAAGELAPAPPLEQAWKHFEETVHYWRHWLSKCTYRGRWREIVHRSALALKLLTFAPTGAMVASPTTSLPEHIGGSRNWDYRYTWIRDSSYTIDSLMRLGFYEEAKQFMGWLDSRCHETGPRGSLQVMYGIEGGHDLAERILKKLEGYRHSKPVRIGNAAYAQNQLDVYGELLDAIYLYDKHGDRISHDLWIEIHGLVDWLCDHWQHKDHGIWEVRGEPQHFVHSKVMAWVALDRGLRISAKRSFPADVDRWLKTRDHIYRQVIERGWSSKRQAFVQYYGGDSLDASTLVLPLVSFLSPTDPRILGTLDAICRPRQKGGLLSGSLVHRYNPQSNVDGLEGGEGAFSICTFWLIDALTRAGREDPRRLARARFLFEEMLGYANHLGLYAEEIGESGEALGNFPQALTHLALITVALNLDRELDRAERRTG
jgi:GH15 family glucan-1,4-alpha-glucosidase